MAGWRKVAATAEAFIAMTKPTLVNGMWRKPKLSARNIARIRKETIAAGEEFPIPRKPLKSELPQPVQRAQHKKIARKAKRLKMIEEGLKKQDKLIADHKKQKRTERQAARKTGQLFEPFPMPKKR
eukprot:m.23861 g.23861  ORF g.23861 m.23861 type:complete len:126 (+) comp13256_c0_seq1:95-472(+)